MLTSDVTLLSSLPSELTELISLAGNNLDKALFSPHSKEEIEWIEKQERGIAALTINTALDICTTRRCKDGKLIRYYAINNEGKVISSPYRRGSSERFLVSLDDGRSFTVDEIGMRHDIFLPNTILDVRSKFLLLQERNIKLELDIDLTGLRSITLKYLRDTLAAFTNPHYRKLYVEMCCCRLDLPWEISALEEAIKRME